jgi:tetraacyldisaccharide 4'-kinase
LLHARNLPGVPVLIGRDRAAMVRYAMRRFAPDVVVLDDAFQYWSLPRTLDIVLLDARQPFGNRRLLPLGPLRELPQSLQRADVVMLTRAGAASALEKQATREEVRRWTKAPIWEASHEPFAVRNEVEGADVPSQVLHDAPVAALSALAHNHSFVETLRDGNAQLLGHLARRDHHHWHAGEVQRFARAMALRGARAIVTTEKDAVKLQPEWTQPLPLWTLRIVLQVEDGTGLINWVESRLRAEQSSPDNSSADV